MEEDFNTPIIQFQQIVNNLRTELEVLSKNHAAAEEEPEKLKQEYHTKIIPGLLQLRKLNRTFKERGELKSNMIDQFNRRLVNLKEKCDNITFEASCLNHEVVSAKRRLSPTKNRDDGDINMPPTSNGNEPDFFDIDEVGLMEHDKRLQVVDREEARRKSLQERLAEATAETNEIALVCEDSSAQLNRLKPYIRQLLDKVDLGDSARGEKKS